MAEKITPEMREQLRAPLPPEAVSPHPTRKYLSTIKAIYVAERINDVFGIGSWTLKGEPIEMTEHIVMRVVLEIPEYGFYGEAYGGNANDDRGDAFKGAVTDGFTKIAAQQLEIGIDVFKGLQPDNNLPTPINKEHWCEKHNTAFFKKGRMKSYAHPIKDADGQDTGEWCHEHTGKSAETPPEPDNDLTAPDEPKVQEKPQPSNIDPDWLTETLKLIHWTETTALSWIKANLKIEAKGKLLDACNQMSVNQLEQFVAKVKDLREASGN